MTRVLASSEYILLSTRHRLRFSQAAAVSPHVALGISKRFGFFDKQLAHSYVNTAAKVLIDLAGSGGQYGSQAFVVHHTT